MTNIWKWQSDCCLPGGQGWWGEGMEGGRCGYKRAAGEDRCNIGTVQHLDCVLVNTQSCTGGKMVQN